MKKQKNGANPLFFSKMQSFGSFYLIELVFNQISLLARFARLNIKNSQANAFLPYTLLLSKENIRASYVINVIFACYQI